jgi:hypothetical protein
MSAKVIIAVVSVLPDWPRDLGAKIHRSRPFQSKAHRRSVITPNCIGMHVRACAERAERTRILQIPSSHPAFVVFLFNI